MGKRLGAGPGGRLRPGWSCSKAAAGKMNLYESFAQATQLGDLHTCLMMDMKACQEDDVRLLCHLTPSIYTEVSPPPASVRGSSVPTSVPTLDPPSPTLMFWKGHFFPHQLPSIHLSLKVEKCLKPAKFLCCALSVPLSLASRPWPPPLNPGQSPDQVHAHRSEPCGQLTAPPRFSPQSPGPAAHSAFASPAHSQSSLGTGTGGQSSSSSSWRKFPGTGKSGLGVWVWRGL